MSGASTVKVRPLTRADRSEWGRLWEAYLAFYGTTRPAEIYDTYFERLLGDDPQDFHALVADMDGHLVGLTHFLFHRHGWRVESVCYLQDLYAEPDQRGRGIGRALIEAVYQSADLEGCPQVYWLTQDSNVQARQLYDRVARLSPFIKYDRVV